MGGTAKEIKGPVTYNLCDGIGRPCSQHVEIYSVDSRDNLIYGCNKLIRVSLIELTHLIKMEAVSDLRVPCDTRVDLN
jgi:hypothetical protein